MKRILLTYTLAFILLPVYGGEGGSSPAEKKSLLIDYVSENKYDKDARWWSTPYEHTNCFFTGYAHVNLSGVGCPELGSLLLMPTTGELNVDYTTKSGRGTDK